MHHLVIVTRLEGGHIEQLEELVAAATAADGHEPLGEHKFLRISAGDEPARAFLAYEGKRLVGYAHTLAYGEGDERRVSCEVVVHPEHRREGIGRALLTEVLRVSAADGAARFDVWAYNDQAVSRRLAESLGLSATRQLLHMHRHPGGPLHVPAPEGARVRAFERGVDDEPWLELNNRIFREHPENGSWTLDDLRARMEQDWFQARDFLVLEVGGTMKGFCWLKVEEREGEGCVGEIYVIGTAPEVQGMGLGRFVLSAGLEHLAARGVDAVAVYVDQSNEKAVTLYWAIEFHHHHVDVMYSVALPAGDEGGAARDRVSSGV
jgi:mycothiol synthase